MNFDEMDIGNDQENGNFMLIENEEEKKTQKKKEVSHQKAYLSKFIKKRCQISIHSFDLTTINNQNKDGFQTQQILALDAITNNRSFYHSSYEVYNYVENCISALKRENNVFKLEEERFKIVDEACKKYIVLLKENESLQVFNKFDLSYFYLIKVMHLTNYNDKCCNYLLINWNNLFLKESETVTNEIELELSNNPSNISTKVWTMIYKFGLKGKTIKIFEMLKNYLKFKAKDSEVYSYIRKVFSMRFIPICYPHNSNDKFLMNFKTWQNYFIQILEKYETEIDPNLINLLKIFVGEEASIKRYSENWTDYFVASLLYKFPVLQKKDLFSLAMKCFPDPNKNVFDCIVLAILDIEGVTNNCYRLLGLLNTYCSKWFMAHITNLLYHVEVVDKRILYHDTKLSYCEYYTTEYVEELFFATKDCDFWKISLLYLTFGDKPKRAKRLIEFYVDKIPIHVDEKKFQQVVSFCERISDQSNEIDLNKVINRIRKKFAINIFKKFRNFGLSIHHFFKALDFKNIMFISDIVCDNYFCYFTTQNNSKNESSLVDLKAIGSYLSTCHEEGNDFLHLPNLCFIKEYTELLNLIDDGQGKLKMAAKKLIKICNMKDKVSEKFWYVLLVHAITLIEDNKTKQVFTRNEVYVLQNLFQKMVSHHDNDFLKQINQDDLRNHRMRLVRCLCK